MTLENRLIIDAIEIKKKREQGEGEGLVKKKEKENDKFHSLYSQIVYNFEFIQLYYTA
jgi:hypothetical protein